MKIIIDSRMIFDRIHGIARYLVESFRIWQDMGIPHEIVLLTNKPETLEKLGITPGFEAVEVKSRPFQVGEFQEIPSVLKKIGGDLYYAPSIAVPLWEVMPTVITVPDLIPMHQGGAFHKIYCKTVLRNAVKFSRKVMTISEFIKDEIVRYLGGDPGKIRVTYLAADPLPEVKTPWEDIEKKFSLKKPYLFCLANPKPHKNLAGLIDIFGIIKSKYKGELHLVMGSRTSDELEEKIQSSPYSKDITRIDYFEDSELDAVYRNTKIFTYTSYFEGFGLPPLEAMARGIPVVSSDRASLAEVVQDGGILHDPDDMEAFAQSVISLLEDEKKFEEFRKKGLKQAEKFSYKKYAEEVLEIFEEVVKQK